MRITKMSQMWALLQVHSTTSAGDERPVNHLNEWGGFSKKLGMPVFTAWRDHTVYDQVAKTVTALVSDKSWSSAVGVNNQERWLKHSEDNNDSVAAFFIIHAVDVNASPRKVDAIDDEGVFVGKVVREGTKTYIVGKRRQL